MLEKPRKLDIVERSPSLMRVACKRHPVSSGDTLLQNMTGLGNSKGKNRGEGLVEGTNCTLTNADQRSLLSMG